MPCRGRLLNSVESKAVRSACMSDCSSLSAWGDRRRAPPATSERGLRRQSPEKRIFGNSSPAPRKESVTLIEDAPVHYLDLLSQWVQSAMYDGWAWVNRLSLEEWFVLLGLTAAVGFLAMRGFSNKDRC